MNRHHLTAALAALVALLACGCAFAQTHEPVGRESTPDDAEILRATFDEGYSEFYGRGFEAEIARGLSDVLLLGRDRGNEKDIGLYRATTVEGVVENGIRMERGQSHRYHAPGNVNLRRGTVAFWVKFDQPVGEVSHMLFSILPVGRAGTVLGVRGRYGKIRVSGPWGGHDDDVYFEAQPWDADTWYHMALAWDETSGIRLFKDGELTFSTGMTWETEDFEPDSITIGSWSPWGGTQRPFEFDELRVFSRPLSDDEVREVYEQRSQLPAIAAEWTPEIATHRAAYLGWEGQGLLEVEPSGEDQTLLVRQAGLNDARAIHAQAWKVCDGDRSTRWPLTYHGYSFQDEGGLIVNLDEGERWDYLRIRGHCRGSLYHGEHIFEPEEREAWMPLRSGGPLLAREFDGAQTETAMTFFADEQDEDGDEPPVRVREVGFYETGQESVSDLAGRRESLYLSDEMWTNWQSEIGRIVLSKYETYDRTALRCVTEAPGEARALQMEGLHYYHLMLQPGPADRALGGIRARMYFRDLEPGTTFWLLAADPLIPTRQIADFEVTADPDANWEGIQAVDLTLDIRDTVIPAGRPLWVRLLASNDVELIWDAEHQSRFELLIEPAEVLADEYRHDRLAYVKDRFIDVSEPRPWGRQSMDTLGERIGIFMELNRALKDLTTRFPDDSYARAVHIWTHPRDPVHRERLSPPTHPTAPEWAVYQRAALRKYLDFAHWWIDHRQAENGEFGHSLKDDTDLVNDWVPLSMISDADGRLDESVRRLADTCYDVLIEDGINRRTTDPLHAYEDGLNAMCRAAEMHPGNPVYLERLMEGVRTVDEHLTGMTEGFRHFKSELYGAESIVTEPPYDRDVLASALMLHGALDLGWWARNERAMRLVQEYGDAWLDLAERAIAEHGPIEEAFTHLPSAVRFEGREVVRTGNTLSGYGSNNMYLALAEWTGDDRYYLPHRVRLMQGAIDAGMAPDLAQRSVMSEYEDLLREQAEGISYEDLLPFMGNDSRSQVHYAAWKQFGDREMVLAALKDSWERIEFLFPMHTWIEQSADRVWISQDLVNRLYLGGQPGYRNYIYPTHAISWQGISPDFAAWVLENDAQGLRLMAYNFEEVAQEGSITVWQLEPGTYRVAMGPDADEDGVPDEATSEREMELAKGSVIDVELPADQIVALQIEQIEASGEDYYARPDLAICPQDTVISEDATTITARVHNIGGGEAPEFTVIARGDDGKPDLAATAGPLEAPHDCMPRVAEVTFEVPDDRRGRQFTVIVDPDDEITELYDANNTVELPAG
ncbi:MAG: LamG-like jellyroll fold domain-containing protein [Armatimonadota bacterium]